MISKDKNYAAKPKRIAMLATMLVCAFLFVACEESKSESYDKEIETAITAIKEEWLDYGETLNIKPYLEIKSTRIIFIKDNAGDGFEGYDYVVEFTLYSDYWGSAPYYVNAGINDSVVVYTDGRVEVQRQSPFSIYHSKTFESDFSNIIDAVVDLGPEYNQILELRE